MIRIAKHGAALILAVGIGLALTTVPSVAQEAAAAGADAAQTRQIRVKILGMSCPFCAYGVEQKLKKLEGVQDLDVELKSGIATLTLAPGADVPNEDLQKAVKKAGFEVAAIVRSFESEYADWNPEKLSGEGKVGTSPGPSSASGRQGR